MNRNDPQIPHREIDADEDELLDRLWEQTAGNESSHPAPSGYAELQERIHRRLRLRRIRRLACTGMAAAVVTAAVLLVGGPAPEAPDAFEQLAEMGVEIDRQEVVMTTDDGQRMNLDEAARLERHKTGEMALNTAHESITIRPERRMKIEVPRGKEFHLTLADGTEVWLNAGSTFEYPASFEGAAERLVTLTGEAFFDVQRDTCRPFRVEMPGGESIRVLGTRFNVHAYTESREHVTTLVEGRIAYRAAETSDYLELQPNQQVRLDCDTEKARIREVDAEVYAAWTEGWLWFEAEPLSELAKRFERTYGIRIVVAEPLRNYTFSGKIRRERGIDYILDLLAGTTGIRCEVNDGVMYLR